MLTFRDVNIKAGRRGGSGETWWAMSFMNCVKLMVIDNIMINK